ncbi:MAG: ketopantoate reductase family protein [Devosia sp.]
MRIIVYGLGAVGGSLAAALSRAGNEVIGIARGRMLEVVKANGLLFRTTGGSVRLHFPIVSAPSDIQFRPDDAILLTMKSQDTAEALRALAEAGVRDQPVFCFQNGLNNERLASRYFANVYGVTVMIPADYTVPGEVACFGTPRYGMFDIGRFPSGLDDKATELIAQLNAANFAALPMEQVLRSKRGKLLENLGNVVDAAMGPGSNRGGDVMDSVRAEARAVYRAAGIDDLVEIGGKDPRRQGVLSMGQVEGAQRAGSSSTQSLKRGAGSIETDYLNGEIVLLGRLKGVPTPLNAALCDLGRDLITGKLPPGTLTEAALRQRLGL